MQNYYQTDIESVKQQLIDFFKTQEEFKDYSFEGSGLSELMNLLAFTVQYQNLYLNFTANELSIQNAQISDNVYKQANTLNYIPKRKSAAYHSVQLQRNDTVIIVIPKFTTWTMGSLTLTNLEDIIINDDSIYAIQLYEGSVETENFVSDGSKSQIYSLVEREDIDNDNLYVYVDDPDGLGGYIISTDEWLNVNKENIDLGSKGYYIYYFETMQIKFDDGNLYTKPTVDQRVRITYLKTSGSSVNGLTSTITLDSSISNYDKLDITPINTLKNGTDEESLDAIRLHAPLFYTTQNRAITEADYNILIKQYSKYDILHSGIVWGGEKEYVDQNGLLQRITPNKDLGHIYVSAFKSDYSYLDNTEQTELLEYLEKYKILALFLKFLQPVQFNVLPTVNIKYRSNIDLDLTSLEARINIFLEEQNGYNTSFYLSDLIRFVDDLNDVLYTTVSYITSVTVYNETHKAIRLNNEITPSSINGSVAGYTFEDDGLGHIFWNSVNIGTVSYEDGIIILDQDFGVDSYTFSFTLADTSNLTVERETFLKFDDINLVVI